MFFTQHYTNTSMSITFPRVGLVIGEAREMLKTKTEVTLESIA